MLCKCEIDGGDDGDDDDDDDDDGDGDDDDQHADAFSRLKLCSSSGKSLVTHLNATPEPNVAKRGGVGIGGQ